MTKGKANQLFRTESYRAVTFYADSSICGHLLVHPQNLLRRSTPRVLLDLFISATTHFLPQNRINQRPVKSTHDLEHILWVDQHRSFSDRLGKRGCVGGN